MRRGILLASVALACSIPFPSMAQAQCSELKRAPQPNPGSGSFYGQAVAVEDDTALVGAYLAPNGGFDSSGIVYAYQRSGAAWPLAQQIVPALGAQTDAFGLSVALSEKTAAIGAVGDVASSFSLAGLVYVYEKVDGVWKESARLEASDASESTFFGECVALRGDRLVVGAGANGGDPAGSAYVFERANGAWTEMQKLVPNDGAPGDRFGTALALAGDRILVGASAASPGDVASGAVYVFDLQHSGWTQTAELSGSGAKADGLFGASLALSDNGKRALVGAPRELPSERGAAYVFEEVSGAWIERVKLTAPMGAAGDHFGYGAALGNDMAVVGAPLVDSGMFNLDRGSAYVFHRLATGQWLDVQTLAPTTQVPQWFGRQSSLSGGTLVVGAPRDLDFRGSVYVIELGGDQRNYCVAAPNSTGQGCTIGSTGTTSVSANDFGLTVAHAPPNASGQFAYATQAARTPFGNGFQCLGGSIHALLPLVSVDGSGSGTFPLDLNALPEPIEPGTSWYFQFAYADAAGGGTGFNLSNGLSVTFCP